MKKLIWVLLPLVCMTGCKFLEREDDLQPRSLYYAYSYQARGRMTDLCDIAVTYYKGDGTTKTDTITSEDLWSKTNYLTTPEVNVGYSVSLLAKDSCLYYEKDTTFHFHQYFAYNLSVAEGVWHGQWDEACTVQCPITKDSLQALLDDKMAKRGIKFYLNKNKELEEAK